MANGRRVIFEVLGRAVALGVAVLMYMGLVSILLERCVPEVKCELTYAGATCKERK